MFPPRTHIIHFLLWTSDVTQEVHFDIKSHLSITGTEETDFFQAETPSITGQQALVVVGRLQDLM